jgi:putative ABC transport system permease protein
VIPFALSLALREGRSSARRLGVYMGAITLGVAALVAINSFRANVAASVAAESKTLLGADLRISSGSPFPDSIRALVDSLAAAGRDVAPVTGTISVVLAPGGATRLVQLRAVSGGYPWYGTFTTEPAGLWGTLEQDRRALLEPELMTALGVRVGDTIRIGESGFRVAAAITGLPPDISFRSAFAPRVFIGLRWLDDTGLLRLGSLVRYQVFVRMPEPGAADDFVDDHRAFLRRQSVGFDTAAEQADDLAFALDTLGRFLGLVGLAALLLGGLGVASAVHVFVKDRRPTIAVLRCLGATQRTAFIAYLLQAALLGFAGAAIGALIGIAIQPVMPRVLADLIPVDVGFRVHWPSVFTGLAIGVWVASIFALLPLLAIRGITPLQALRQEVEPVRRRDLARALAWAALAASIIALAIAQAGRIDTGLAFAGGLAVTLLLLAGCALLLIRATRRFFPARASFVVRQGIASLFRPHNQTAAVTVALGFGVFLVVTLWVVQHNVLRRFELDAAGRTPNLVAFDIQSDQRAAVIEAFEALGLDVPELVPIVPARIAAIEGRPVAELRADTASRREPWALRREYRNTYRAALSGSEELVSGEWWDAARPAGALPRISIEEDLARDLDVGIGDRVTWDVQGVHIDTRIASMRRVDWARFETNFFVVFEPGVLEDAPQSFVTLAEVPGDDARAALQRDVVRRHPNISFVDLALVRRTIERVVGRVTIAVRFMGLFSVACGILVLAGAIAASRFQRLRESVLLRTLGATRRQIRRILLTEYLALGALAAVAGATLAAAAAWALMRFLFDMAFHLPAAALLAACAAAILIAVAVGFANSREALRGTPLAVLREAD